MSDIDRYITDEVIRFTSRQVSSDPKYPSIRSILRAALPGILAAHRADVLHDLVAEVMRECKSTDKAQVVLTGLSRKARQADEAVAE